MAIKIKNVDKKDQLKCKQIVQILEKHKSIVDFIGKRQCSIELVTGDENPSWIWAKKHIVELGLSYWFLEGYPLGYCLGMMCHEFGVHPMADTKRIIEQEKIQAKDKLPVLGVTNVTICPAEAIQQDHGFGMLLHTPRGQCYRNTVIEMAMLVGGRAMLTRLGAQCVADLIDCHLMDVAATLVTNDDKIKGAFKTKVMAELYNYRRTDIIEAIEAKPNGKPIAKKIAKLVPPTKKGAILKKYGKLGLSLLFGEIKNKFKSKRTKKSSPFDTKRMVFGHTKTKSVFDQVKSMLKKKGK